MRILQIVGGILIAGGLFVLIKAPSYSSEKSVFKIGDVEAKVAQEHPVPPWAGGAAIAAGGVLIVVGARKGEGVEGARQDRHPNHSTSVLRSSRNSRRRARGVLG